MTHKFNIYRKDDIKAFEDATDQKCGGIILKQNRFSKVITLWKIQYNQKKMYYGNLVKFKQ